MQGAYRIELFWDDLSEVGKEKILKVTGEKPKLYDKNPVAKITLVEGREFIPKNSKLIIERS